MTKVILNPISIYQCYVFIKQNKVSHTHTQNKKLKISQKTEWRQRTTTDLSWPEGGSFFFKWMFQNRFQQQTTVWESFQKSQENTVMGESVLVFYSKAASGNSTWYYASILQQKEGKQRKGVVPKKLVDRGQKWVQRQYILLEDKLICNPFSPLFIPNSNILLLYIKVKRTRVF